MYVQDSRKRRVLIMLRPWSSQSITGSAYSCIEAVNMTTVYHDETYEGEQIGSHQLPSMRE
jgi:hypothetical protein